MDKRVFYTIWLISIVWMVWLMYVDAENARKVKKVADEKAAIAAKADPAAEATPDAPQGEVAAADPNAPADAKPKEEEIPLVEDISLGGDTTGKDSPYFLQAFLTNRGGVVHDLFLNKYKSEDQKDRMHLLTEETPGEPSYVLTMEGDESLATKTWKVEENSPSKVTFSTLAHGGTVEVKKEFSLEEGAKAATLAVTLTNKSDKPIPKLKYNLTGGTGLPIEGKWYTRYFRDAIFYQRAANSGSGTLKLETAATVVDNHQEETPQSSFSKPPVQFLGVSAQYFVSLLAQPFDISTEPQKNQIAEAMPRYAGDNPRQPEMSNVAVAATSIPINLKPGESVRHEFLLFNGPKDDHLLEEFKPLQLRESIHHPPFFFIPVAFFSRLLTGILEFFHSIVGDYGVAIIMMTVMVRIFLFPLNFWQSKTMSRMQAIQPLMEQIRKEAGNNLEEYGRRVRELQAKYKVNPYMGCLPAFIQLPILVGLWQGLATDFHLRHAPLFYGYTWVKDLSAPDMLFKWPFRIGFVDDLLGPYFNLLPIISLVQLIMVMLWTAPPPTSPDAVMMRRVMIGMMVFMSFMFYKVPSGLCLYIITGSLWGMAERKLMPKPPLPQGLAELSEQAKVAAAQPEVPEDTSWKKAIDVKKPARR